MRLPDYFSLDNLTTDCKIQLSGCGQVRADQDQISSLSSPVVILRVEKIQQRRRALLVREADGVAHLKGLCQVSLFIRPQQVHITGQRRVGGIEVAEHLSQRRLAQSRIPTDIQLRAEFLSLISIGYAQWNTDVETEVTIQWRVVSVIQTECRVR